MESVVWGESIKMWVRLTGMVWKGTGFGVWGLGGRLHVGKEAKGEKKRRRKEPGSVCVWGERGAEGWKMGRRELGRGGR